MKNGNVVGLSGVAGSGRVLFCELCSTTKNTSLWPLKSFSIAKKLKDECFGFVYEKYGININNCTWEEKNSVREILVAHGEVKRRQSRGLHWIKQLTEDILKARKKYKTVLITDIRFSEYEYDEVQWLRETLDGYLIHISKFDIDIETGIIKIHPPANPTESQNDPKLIKECDYEIEWENLSRIKDGEEREKKLSKTIDKFSEWLQYKAYTNKVVGRKTKKTYVWPK